MRAGEVIVEITRWETDELLLNEKKPESRSIEPLRYGTASAVAPNTARTFDVG